VVAGATSTRCFSTGCSDFWIFKLDIDGFVTWEKTYGGTFCDYAYFIEPTTDGGYVITGATASFGSPKNGRDSLILKLDHDGEIPGCTLRTSQATVLDTIAMAVDTAAVSQSTTVIPADLALIVNDELLSESKEACVSPYIDTIEPSFDSGRRFAGKAITLIGGNFGDTQGAGVVHFNGKAYDSTSSKIKIWSDSLIKIKAPNYGCDKFDAKGVYKRKVWVTVGGVDSNVTKVKLSKPEDCGSN